MVPKIMLTKRKTAGIRVPDHPICMALVEALGNPVISTSAKMPDGTTLNAPWLIEEEFGPRIDVVVDGGPAPGTPSSVISLIDDVPEVLRAGLGDVDIFV